MKDIFNRYYKQYDAWYDKNKYVYLSELEALKQVLPGKGRGLEVGVGTGRFAARLGIEYGIDPSKGMLKFARARGVNVRPACGEELPFRKGFFDYVAVIITLCFVKDPLKVIKESRRVLKKNGEIIIAIIDKDSFLGKFYRRKKSIFYRQAKFFSIKEISNMLKIAGFKRLSYWQTLFAGLEEVDSIEKPVKGFGKGGFVIVKGRLM